MTQNQVFVEGHFYVHVAKDCGQCVKSASRIAADALIKRAALYITAKKQLFSFGELISYSNGGFSSVAHLINTLKKYQFDLEEEHNVAIKFLYEMVGFGDKTPQAVVIEKGE